MTHVVQSRRAWLENGSSWDIHTVQRANQACSLPRLKWKKPIYCSLDDEMRTSCYLKVRSWMIWWRKRAGAASVLAGRGNGDAGKPRVGTLDPIKFSIRAPSSALHPPSYMRTPACRGSRVESWTYTSKELSAASAQHHSLGTKFAYALDLLRYD